MEARDSPGRPATKPLFDHECRFEANRFTGPRSVETRKTLAWPKATLPRDHVSRWALERNLFRREDPAVEAEGAGGYRPA
jgi:hypothetical protein